MTNDEIISELKSLMQLDIDATHAYDQAISRIGLPDVKEQLTLFREDHKRHVVDLSPVMRRLGGKVPEFKPDLKGFLLQGLTALQSAIGTESALKAMQMNEKLTNRSYGAAISKAFPPDVMTVLRKNADDERRHLEYIEDTLRMRPWEGTGAHP